MEGSEGPVDAAVRELREEIGGVGNVEILGLYHDVQAGNDPCTRLPSIRTTCLTRVSFVFYNSHWNVGHSRSWLHQE